MSDNEIINIGCEIMCDKIVECIIYTIADNVI
jgi:hypothetical protein